jgi:hypothetical protein
LHYPVDIFLHSRIKGAIKVDNQIVKYAARKLDFRMPLTHELAERIDKVAYACCVELG